MYTVNPQHVDKVALQSQIEDYPSILISPRVRNKNWLMAFLLEQTAPAYYHALTSEEKDLKTFLHAFVETVQDYDPKFGRQTLEALGTSRVSAATLAEALIGDLNKARPKPRLIALENLDYLTPENPIVSFFHQLINDLPKNTQLVVSGRFIHYQMWMPLVEAGKTYVMGDDVSGRIFAPETLQMPHLEVYGLGGGAVYVNGMPLTTWDGPLPRNLFYYFIDHPLVTRDEVFATFWPNLPTKEATNVFHVTKRKISERLGYEITAYSSGFYKPSGQLALHYDVSLFEKQMESNKNHLPDSPDEWYRAIRLYRSPFLFKVDMSWVQKRRETLRGLYSEALVGIGRAYAKAQDSDQAIGFFLRALKEIPEREDIHRDLMKLYKESGKKDKAIEQYKLLCSVLDRKLSITPSKATQTVYKNILEA